MFSILLAYDPLGDLTFSIPFNPFTLFPSELCGLYVGPFLTSDKYFALNYYYLLKNGIFLYSYIITVVCITVHISYILICEFSNSTNVGLTN
jgi:hypothetical protein